LGGINEKIDRFGLYELVPKLSPEIVKRLGEGVACLGLGRVGPEEQQQSIATDATGTCGYYGGQESQPARADSSDSLLVPLQPEPAKSP
jgi:hypothetical protein